VIHGQSMQDQIHHYLPSCSVGHHCHLTGAKPVLGDRGTLHEQLAKGRDLSQMSKPLHH